MLARLAHRQCKEVEDLSAISPCIGIAIFPLAFIIESIHLRQHISVVKLWPVWTLLSITAYACNILCNTVHGGACMLSVNKLVIRSSTYLGLNAYMWVHRLRQ